MNWQKHLAKELFVGKKVFIKGDLTTNKEYDGYYAVDEMMCFRGEQVTIIRVDEDNKRIFFIFEDEEQYYWTRGMVDIE